MWWQMPAQHPEVFGRLIKRIYEHTTAEGWLQPGDHVVDPFGGVALGGLDAMRLGLHWTGVELEPRFWKIGQENIKLWNARFRIDAQVGHRPAAEW